MKERDEPLFRTSPAEILLCLLLWSCWLLLSAELITCLPPWSLHQDPRTEIIRQGLRERGVEYKYQLLCICKSLAHLFIYFKYLLNGSSVLISNSKLLGSV